MHLISRSAVILCLPAFLLLASSASAQHAYRADGGTSRPRSRESAQALQQRLERQRILSELQSQLAAYQAKANAISSTLNGLRDLIERQRLQNELKRMEREIREAERAAEEAEREAAAADARAREAQARRRSSARSAAGAGGAAAPRRDDAAEAAAEDELIRTRRQAYLKQLERDAAAAKAEESKGEYHYRDVKITITGSDWLFVNTSIWAALTDENGNYTTRPGYLTISNDGDHPVTFSGAQIGRGSPLAGGLVVQPGATVTEYLAIYSSPSKPIQSITATVKYWKPK